MDAGLRARDRLGRSPDVPIVSDRAGRTVRGVDHRICAASSIKASALVFRTPDWPELFPERTGAESMWRLRVEPEVRSGENIAFTLAYEQQLRYASSAAGVTTVGILPSQAPARIASSRSIGV